MRDAVLQAHGITKSFSGVQVLDGVSLTLKRGVVSCLVGENGSGKSTLIKILSGVYPADAGFVTFGSRRLSSLSPLDAIHEGIQVIYQDFSLFPNLTVKENLAINSLVAAGTRFVRPSAVLSLAHAACARLGVDLDLDVRVEDLTVADRQLVAIARSLIENARLIIMDEPTASLTHFEIQKLLALVRQLQTDEGIAFLFVTHKLDEVFEIADEVHVLRNGQLISSGPPEEYSLGRLALEMTGRPLADRTTVSENRDHPKRPIFQVENLARTGSFFPISFDISQGEIFGIAGLLGSGRSALAQALFGAAPATSGIIRLNETEIRLTSIDQAVKNGIAYVPNDRLNEGLFPSHSIERNIISSCLDRLSDRFGLLSNVANRKVASGWLDKLHIQATSIDQSIDTLSGGNQQRAVIGRWLATAPDILILNGPTVGVDVGSKASLHELLRELSETGLAILLISDDIQELIHLTDRILHMQEGQNMGIHETASLTVESLSEMLLALPA